VRRGPVGYPGAMVQRLGVSGIVLVVAAVGAAAASATPHRPTHHDRRAAKAVVQRYAVAFADDRPKASCRLLTHGLRLRYVALAHAHPEGSEPDTCARGFRLSRNLDSGASLTAPVGSIARGAAPGPRRLLGFAEFDRGHFGFEVDVAKVRGRWRVYADYLCDVPSQCPPPRGT
jgi:hypothetical protein